MPTHDSFPDVMARLRAGDDAAAADVFGRFARRLAVLARRHLDTHIRQKVDPEEVVQSAYKSFFLRFEDGKLDVADWENLWGLMTLLTVRKCADRAEYFGAQRRAVNREVSADAPARDGDGGSGWHAAIDREPTPDEAAALAETVEKLLEGLDEFERPVVELTLEGYSTEEISRHLGRAERSVRRLRERVRKRLEEGLN
jgi:RNA polymerase sigma-70 factor (ECF subfamily)